MPDRDSNLVPGLSVVTSAHNEQSVLTACLDSVDGLADELVVVDAGSTDGTADLARRHGATVLSEPNRLMLNTNKNVAIDAARREWVLLIDPDERVSPALADEIRGVVDGTIDQSADAYWILRRNHELGRWIKTMGAHPDPQLRLFRNGHARFPCRHIHEMVEARGRIGHLTGHLEHEPRQSVFEYVHKRNLYSEHRAAELARTGAKFRLHRLLLRPPAFFVKNYVLRGGWREGVPGLIMAVTGAFGTFLQDAKLWQRTRSPEIRSPEADAELR